MSPRHAQARPWARVNLELWDGLLTLLVRDDGKGMRGRRPVDAGSIGISGNAGAGESRGRSLEIHSTPGEGTEVVSGSPPRVG